MQSLRYEDFGQGSVDFDRDVSWTGRASLNRLGQLPCRLICWPRLPS